MLIKRLTQCLERQGIIVRDEHHDIQLPIDAEDTFSKLQASSAVYRFATGPRRGQRALVLGAVQDSDHNSRSGLVANVSGFSLHAVVECAAHDRDKLERIARYVARPAISEERLSTNSVGDVVKISEGAPFKDSTAHMTWTSKDFSVAVRFRNSTCKHLNDMVFCPEEIYFAVMDKKMTQAPCP